MVLGFSWGLGLWVLGFRMTATVPYRRKHVGVNPFGVHPGAAELPFDKPCSPQTLNPKP